MAKKRKREGNLTAEDWARYHETRRLLAERLAYHEQKAREQDARRAQS